MEDHWTKRKEKLEQLLFPLCPRIRDLTVETGLWSSGAKVFLPKGGSRVVFAQALREFTKWLALRRYGYEPALALKEAKKGLATFGLFMPKAREKIKEEFLMAKEAMFLFSKGNRPVGKCLGSLWLMARLALIGKRGFSPEDLWHLKQGPRPFESEAFLGLTARLEDDFGFRFPGRWKANGLSDSYFGESFSEAIDLVLENQGLALTSASLPSLSKRLSLRFGKALACSCLDGEGRLREPTLKKVVMYFPVPSNFLVMDVGTFLRSRRALVSDSMLGLKVFGRHRI